MTEIQSPSRQELIDRIRDLAEKLGKRSISRSEFIRGTGINEHHVSKHFGSWNEFVGEAGLEPHMANRRVDDDDLMLAMHEAFATAGTLTRARFRQHGRYSADVYSKRFGGWRNALLALREWVEEQQIDAPYLVDLPTGAARPTAIGPTRSGPVGVWPPSGRTQYGPFLNFRGLQHAPINEQGVVYLFGMIAFDLGYVVEGIGTGFPDCEAKRAVDRGGDAWERVRIEFEYRSRNFYVHGHDPARCDVLVCWEDNWPECPLEVLELRSAVGKLGE